MSRKARVFVSQYLAGVLEEVVCKKQFAFTYVDGYEWAAVSLTMPTFQKTYTFERVPPFFDGLLPEGFMLEALPKIRKNDRDDHMSQALIVGHDMVGNVTVEEIL
jgi:serine/threonine-protein kinase HipA